MGFNSGLKGLITSSLLLRILDNKHLPTVTVVLQQPLHRKSVLRVLMNLYYIRNTVRKDYAHRIVFRAEYNVLETVSCRASCSVRNTGLRIESGNHVILIFW
jgi:hypothetical protein